jgi:hypothetical protein
MEVLSTAKNSTDAGGCSWSEVNDRLSNVFQDWGANLPDRLKPYVSKCFIAGGSIASLFNGENPRDYDIFASDSRTAEVFRNYFLGIPARERLAAVKAANLFEIGAHGIFFPDSRIHFVTSYFGSPFQVIGNFDFIHTEGFYLDGLAVGDYTKKCIESRQLVYTNSKNPIGSFMRLFKFVERGWSCQGSQVRRILSDIEDLTDSELLGHLIAGS